jgi:hypothetical protein
MKFSELTKEQIKLAKSIYTNKEVAWDERMKELIVLFGKSERTTRKWCVALGFKEKADIESEQYEEAKKRKLDTSKKRFIITWAQNNTTIHKGFYENMEAYAKYIKADIHIILGRYKNPTSLFQEKDSEVWADEVVKYADANRHNVHKYLSIMSDVKIQPTATNPMSGLQGMSGVNSCIFGSPKVQLEMIPVLDSKMPKMMLTTGSITKINYTDSKAGKKGEFHHVYGFVVVEIKDKDKFFVRQVTADDKTGDFTDLCHKVSKGSVSKIDKISAIVFGDLHYGNHDDEVINQTIKMLDKIKPKHVVLHDVFDGSSINHHEMKNPFMQYAKEVHGTNSLKREVDGMLDGLKRFEKFPNVVIVRSNHDDFVDRWLMNEDWKRQPTSKNSPEYMRYSGILLDQYAANPGNVKGVIPALINERYPKYITLTRSSTYKINGNWELGQHGDVGSNGSRGSLMQFRRLNTKVVVGHYHSPGRKDGAISVGTSTKLRIGYNNSGSSTWLQSHVIIHEDGKAQHINFISGEYTTFKF